MKDLKVPHDFNYEMTGSVEVMSSTNDFVTVLGSGVFWNTQPEQIHGEPVPISFELTLIESIDQSTLPIWGFWNPYLMVNRVLGHERLSSHNTCRCGTVWNG
ncbi:MAG: hypothetical protein PHQ78_03480 [Candidatus Cloacimonetes bacterium]|nr:hypothetical protein [Candidatus Cloacimonadota bacterium]MDD2506361.1 hypothetical protein [Candidatus Cloacimonadota bacterium]MDD4560071.1 hypothetical protein [Candidatus Cloacimonadota bacterium]